MSKGVSPGDKPTIVGFQRLISGKDAKPDQIVKYAQQLIQKTNFTLTEVIDSATHKNVLGSAKTGAMAAIKAIWVNEVQKLDKALDALINQAGKIDTKVLKQQIKEIKNKIEELKSIQGNISRIFMAALALQPKLGKEQLFGSSTVEVKDLLEKLQQLSAIADAK